MKQRVENPRPQRRRPSNLTQEKRARKKKNQEGGWGCTRPNSSGEREVQGDRKSNGGQEERVSRDKMCHTETESRVNDTPDQP